MKNVINEDGSYTEEFINTVYLYGNVEEEETSFLFTKDKFIIKGTTLTPDRSDCYLTIYLNGFMSDNGCINTEPIICRVSIINSNYIENPVQPGIKLNKEQKELLVDYTYNNFGNIIMALNYTYHIFDYKPDMNKYANLKKPKFELLETID